MRIIRLGLTVAWLFACLTAVVMVMEKSAEGPVWAQALMPISMFGGIAIYLAGAACLAALLQSAPRAAPRAHAGTPHAHPRGQGVFVVRFPTSPRLWAAHAAALDQSVERLYRPIATADAIARTATVRFTAERRGQLCVGQPGVSSPWTLSVQPIEAYAP